MHTKSISVVALCALSACGGSGGGEATPLFFGSTNGDASANGLAFADGTQVLSDVDGQTLNIKVARYLTDYETGKTSLVISDETISIDPANGGDVENFTVTIGDETLVFTDSEAADSNSRPWDSYLNSSEDVSATGAVYSYSYGGDEDEAGALDTEAFFAFGFETDPDTIAALLTNPSYSGLWSGYGGIVDENGDVLESEVYGEGDIDLIADFAAGTIDGDLTGDFDGFDVSGTIASTSIQGNGFSSDVDLATCDLGFTCVSDTQAAGVFYGENGEEISGILGFDATRTNDVTGDAERLLSGAGFTAIENAPVLLSAE